MSAVLSKNRRFRRGTYMLLNSAAITSTLAKRLSGQIKGKTFQFEIATDSKNPTFDLLEIY